MEQDSVSQVDVRALLCVLLGQRIVAQVEMAASRVKVVASVCVLVLEGKVDKKSKQRELRKTKEPKANL
jgi:hypothetical protein